MQELKPVSHSLSRVKGFDMVAVKGVSGVPRLLTPWMHLPFLPVQLEDDVRQQPEEELGEQ